MRRLIAYTRVSTDLQQDNTSLDWQWSRIQKYCEFSNYEIVHHCSDVESAGGKKFRKGLAEAFAMVESGQADGIICSALDRFSRSVSEGLKLMQELSEKGKQLVILDLQLDTSSPLGECIFTVLLALAQLERKQINKRCRDGKTARLEKGLYTHGRPPYGWKAVNKTLVPDRFEQKWRTYILDRRDAGASNWEIAKELNDLEIPAKSGGKWHAGSIYSITVKNYPVRQPVMEYSDDDDSDGDGGKRAS